MDESSVISGTAAEKPTIVSQAEQDELIHLALASGVCSIFSTRCPGKQTPNEDAAAVVPLGPERAVLIVADGMGGTPAGERAATLAVQSVIDAIRNSDDDPALLRVAILDGFEHANQAVRALGVGAGTTMSVVEINERTARPYHVGDSEILVVGQRGRIKLQTLAHSPVAYAVEAGLLDQDEAMHHDERHIISNMIGAESMRIDIGSPVALAQRDTVLLASDGLCDNLQAAEIVEHIRRGPLETAVQGMIDHARQRMDAPQPDHPSKPDDLTFVLFRFAT